VAALEVEPGAGGHDSPEDSGAVMQTSATGLRPRMVGVTTEVGGTWRKQSSQSSEICTENGTFRPRDLPADRKPGLLQLPLFLIVEGGSVDEQVIGFCGCSSCNDTPTQRRMR